MMSFPRIRLTLPESTVSVPLVWMIDASSAPPKLIFAETPMITLSPGFGTLPSCQFAATFQSCATDVSSLIQTRVFPPDVSSAFSTTCPLPRFTSSPPPSISCSISLSEPSPSKKCIPSVSVRALLHDLLPLAR